MGKIRVRTLGDEGQEKEQKKEAKLRRDSKKEKKSHVKGLGLKGGQQIAVMEGTDLKSEFESTLPGSEATDEAKKKAKRKKVAKVRSKRYQELRGRVDAKKLYTLSDAVKLAKDTAKTKFVASLEMHVSLTPTLLSKEKPTVSGTLNLPHGTGKKKIIKIVDEALLESVAAGKFEFDMLVAHPSMMPKLAKYARVLGPKGLMPNPKNKTVTTEPEKRAKELEGGEVNWKTESGNPLIHQVVGKTSFTEKQLEENIKALVTSISTTRITKLTLNATMGPGIHVDINSL